MIVDRRAVMTASGLSLAAGPRASTAAGTKRGTFVLIHGTWLGGWIWADVAERLRRNGHRVFTPTLTGVGERHHLANPAIGLDTHIADVVNVIDFEDLRDVILVGHGFSGVTMTGVADLRRDRIAHVAFFDALIPHTGRMTALELTASGDEPDYFKTHRKDFIQGYLMDFLAVYPMKMLVADDQPAMQESIRRRITPHPCKPWTDTLVLKNGGWTGLPRTCFRTTRQGFAPSSEKMWGTATQPGWHLIDVPCDRMGMMTAPDQVAGAFTALIACSAVSDARPGDARESTRRACSQPACQSSCRPARSPPDRRDPGFPIAR